MPFFNAVVGVKL